MDIHKPKPWHGGREFLKEYLIIVVGVLTALGAEQAVELIHRDAQVAETREALKRELADNLVFLKLAVAEYRCAQARDDGLIAWAMGGPRRVPTERRYMTPLHTSVWEFSKAGAVSRMPLNEGLAFANYYDRVALYNSNTDIAHERAGQVGAFTNFQKLSTSQAERLMEEVHQEENITAYQIGNAEGLIAAARRLGAEDRPLFPAAREHIKAYCQQAGAAVPEI